MTVQWTVVATFLYAEIGIICVMLLPWIRPSLWTKVFRSRIVRAIEAYSYVYSYAFAGILFLFLLDAIREVRKYSNPQVERETMIGSPHADTLVHMRLFRAQRNLYIAGFALFLWLVIRRMMNLLMRSAQLEASAEAAVKQAQSANAAAQKLMDNDGKGGEKEKDGEAGEREAELEKKVSMLRKELDQAEMDRDAMKTQADAVKREYDRLLAEHMELQEHGDKKSD